MGSRTLVISTMKDEGPYILEWVAYHRAIGFTDFLIYTNDCSDGTDLILDRLQHLGIVTHEQNDVLRRGVHKSALKYAMEHPLYAEADWAYVTDADEFLNVRAGDGTLADLFAAYPDADVIPVTWRIFSFGGREDLGTALVLESLDQCEPAAAAEGEKPRFVKSLFRPTAEIERLGLHAPVFAEEARDAVAWGTPSDPDREEVNPERPAGDFGYGVAQVNHYAVRTLDAFLMKKNRGRANHMSEDLGLDYWIRWNRGGETDRSILRQLDRLRAEIAGLTEDPILDHLHRGALAYHRRKVAELKALPDYAALREDILRHEGMDPAATRVPAPPPGKERRHANRMKLLEQMPKKGRCAEIGVWNGGFSDAILKVTAPRELVLIDPWDLIAATSTDEQTHSKHSDAQAMREMYDHVQASYGELPNVIVRKGFSAEVLESYPDRYFDWIYIDGNHLYDFVAQDLRVAFRKVRAGGIVSGDDFFWKQGGRMHVREAVLDVSRELGLSSRPTRFGQQYMMRVPD